MKRSLEGRVVHEAVEQIMEISRERESRVIRVDSEHYDERRTPFIHYGLVDPKRVAPGAHIGGLVRKVLPDGRLLVERAPPTYYSGFPI